MNPGRESSMPPAVDPCLSEDEIVAFAAGQLASSHRQNAHAHLDRCELCQQLLSEAMRGMSPSSEEIVTSDPAWGTTFRRGALVGQRYEIRRFIARGGMGEVYEAFDRELQERVALKTVTSTACDSPAAVRRLKAEVQLARRVSHPNVCRIYDFGSHVMPTTGGVVSFLTMEFVDGPTLGQRVRQGALPLPQAQSLARELLRALRAAHQAGVLHRDFKSDNVMLRETEQGPSAVILDFGLARALGESSLHSSSGHHSFVGTFSYVAPEQLEGKPHTTASDVYSFGVVWFEMLTGRLPFEQGSGSATLTALERLQRDGPPPSSKNAALPAEVDGVVLGCLRRDPTQRLRTADEVLSRLDASELAPPPRRRRGRVAGAVAIALGLLASAVVLAAVLVVTLPGGRNLASPKPAAMELAATLVVPPAVPARLPDVTALATAVAPPPKASSPSAAPPAASASTPGAAKLPKKKPIVPPASAPSVSPTPSASSSASPFVNPWGSR